MAISASNRGTELGVQTASLTPVAAGATMAASAADGVASFASDLGG
jgi:hypothetical protein